MAGKYKITWSKSIPDACKNGWRYYTPTDSWYYFNNQSMTWNNACNYCKKRGAYLTSILSSEENQFISQCIGGHVIWVGLIWIGLQGLFW